MNNIDEKINRLWITMTKLADEYSKKEWKDAENSEEHTVTCTNCGHDFSDPLPLLYDKDTDDYFHGCPYCLTDACLMDLDSEE